MLDLDGKARFLGDSLAASLQPRAKRGASVAYATVIAVRAGELDVDMSGSLVEGVPALSACASAKPGDRCLVIADGPLVTAIGTF